MSLKMNALAGCFFIIGASSQTRQSLASPEKKCFMAAMPKMAPERQPTTPAQPPAPKGPPPMFGPPRK
jgi:hypothetical protein